MLAGTETIATIAEHWLAQFEQALANCDDVLLETLFHPDSHWRDVLALTWHIRTVNGLDAVRQRAESARRPSQADWFQDRSRSGLRPVT